MSEGFEDLGLGFEVSGLDLGFGHGDLLAKAY